jgi:hypothetical protein
VPHLCTALVTLSQPVLGTGGHSYKVTRCTEVCATTLSPNPSRPFWPFPRVPHLCMAIDIQHQSVSDSSSYPRKIWQHAATCVIAHNASHPLGTLRPFQPFPQVLHPCAAFNIQHQSVSDSGSHPRKIQQHAATCMISHDASHPLGTLRVSFPKLHIPGSSLS